MSNLEIRITCYPPIPLCDLTPLDRLVLSHVLDCSETDEGFVLFTDLGPTNPIRVRRADLLEAYHASVRYAESALNAFFSSRVISLLPLPSEGEGNTCVDIDLNAFPWQFVVQDAVARSSTLREVVVIQWMNHPSQRPDSFGASVSLITARAIHHATSEDLLTRLRQQDHLIRHPK